MKTYNNCMTLSNSGSVGYLFYHDYDFVASDHCTVIWLKDQSVELNQNIYLYLKVIIELMRPRYNFGREINNARLKKEYIYLPIIENTEASIDWQYMEDYIKNLISTTKFNNIESTNTKNEEINLSSWKEFEITEIFPQIESGKISNAALLQEGTDIPYIGAKKKDAGVIKWVASNDDIISHGPCFSFICDGDGSVGYTNYIPFTEFACTVNVHLGKNELINKYNALFLVSVMDLQRQKYSFGRKWGKRLNKTKVFLPATEEGKVDWVYMEEYIKACCYGDLI